MAAPGRHRHDRLLGVPARLRLSASLSPGGTLLTANSLFSNFDIGSYIALFQDPLGPTGRGSSTRSHRAHHVVLHGGALRLAAYAFSRMRFRGRRAGLLTLLLVQMFPQLLAVVAIFLLMSAISDVFPALV